MVSSQMSFFDEHLDRKDLQGPLGDSVAVQTYYRGANGAFYNNGDRTRKGSDFDGTASKNDETRSENVDKGSNTFGLASTTNSTSQR